MDENQQEELRDVSGPIGEARTLRTKVDGMAGQINVLDRALTTLTGRVEQIEDSHHGMIHLRCDESTRTPDEVKEWANQLMEGARTGKAVKAAPDRTMLTNLVMHRRFATLWKLREVWVIGLYQGLGDEHKEFREVELQDVIKSAWRWLGGADI